MAKKISQICAFLLLLTASGVVAAQGGVETIVTLKNESVDYQFLSRYQPALGRYPENGTVKMVEDPLFNYTLTYTPDQDHIGSDEFMLVSFPFGYSYAFTEFKVSIQEAEVKANHDFAQTLAGVPVTVSVMDNDFTNTDLLELTATPVANSGSVSIEGNEVIFTPALGFSGLADFNYVICTYGNTCDLGTVTVNVIPEAGAGSGDTIRVFTKRDQPQYIFAPEDANPQGVPVSGTMTTLDGVMAYQPNEDFVGDEYLSYLTDGQTNPTVFHVTVLDLEEKKFTSEDRAYTAIDSDRKFNVLHNDLYSVFADCVSFGSPRFGTLTTTNVKGEVIYTPPTGWKGVDQFTYTSQAPGCEGPAETQTVYVHVSDFAPADDNLLLTTSVGLPIQLTYDIPGGNASWLVVSSPSQGTVTLNPLTGQLDYLPLPTAVGSVDELVLEYCLNEDATGDCQFSKEVTVTINITAENPNACIDGEDCVWPGDTNKDGAVDVGDLLPIGLAMGRSGTPRLSSDASSWSAQYSEDWEEELNGIDLKHIDANGDQIISHLDTQVVLDNMGLGHRLRPTPQNFADFDVTLSGSLDAAPGDLVKFDILAGSNVVIVEDVYGFIFPFNFDENIIQPNSVEVKFQEEGWMGYDSPLISLSRSTSGQLQAAVSRTSGTAISGFGKVGELSVVIVEDVYGFDEVVDPTADDEVVTLGGQAAAAMNGDGHINAVRVLPTKIRIKRTPAIEVADLDINSANNFLDENLIAYPNPTANNLTVHLNGQQRFNALRLTDITGRTVRHEAGLDTNHRELNLADLPNGVYTLTLTTEGGVVNRKVEVVH